jgi:cytochrome oxidase Cu insertion factor (SCO1/SenC/PrrC family)
MRRKRRGLSRISFWLISIAVCAIALVVAVFGSGNANTANAYETETAYTPMALAQTQQIKEEVIKQESAKTQSHRYLQNTQIPNSLRTI